MVTMLALTSPLRRLLVLMISTGAALAILALTGPVAITASRDLTGGSWRNASFDDLLVTCCALVATAATSWWWWGTLRLVTALGPVLARTGPAGTDRTGTAPVSPALLPHPAGLPGWWRRAVLSCCGVALATGPVAPSLASTAEPTGPTAETSSIAAHTVPAATGDRPATGPGGLPLPDRVAGRPAGAPVARPDRTPAPRRESAGTGSTEPTGPTSSGAPWVVVEPGDSLWTIARSDLVSSGSRPAVPTTAGEVAERWRAIYHLNDDRIGPDPDLILPGQHLRLPPLPT